jgi:hypothetical protein
MVRPLGLLAASTLALLVLGAWTRPGRPVALLMPPGEAGAAAFAVPGWRVLRIGTAGPLGLLVAVPETAAAEAGALRRATGAWIVVAALPAASCRPAP